MTTVNSYVLAKVPSVGLKGMVSEIATEFNGLKEGTGIVTTMV
jgi:hypothetical protein